MTLQRRFFFAVAAFLCTALFSFTADLSAAVNSAHTSVAQAPAAPFLPPTALRYQWDILHNTDIDASSRFLKDEQAQQWFVENKPSVAKEIFSHALRIKDAQELLNTYEDPSNLRFALLQRGRGEKSWRVVDALVQKSQSPSLKQLLAIARWDWDTLPKGLQEDLSQQGTTQQDWTTCSPADRYLKTEPWETNRLKELLSITPKSKADLQRMEKSRQLIWDSLETEQKISVQNRMDKAERAVRLLARAQARLRTASNRNWALLAQEARNASDLDQMLSSLGKLFEAMGIHDKNLAAVGSDLPQEEFSEEQLIQLDEHLRASLPQEVQGTLAGDKVRIFYNRYPLKLSIYTGDDHSFRGQYIHWYENIQLNADVFIQFLKTNGSKIGRLIFDAHIAHPLVQLAAVTFIHETTHREQDVWSRKLGISLRNCQVGEIEASTLGFLHALEKMRTDPSFRQMLGRDALAGGLSQDTLEMVHCLESNVVKFKKIILYAYSQLPSLESAMISAAQYPEPWADNALSEMFRELRQRARQGKQPATKAATGKDASRVDETRLLRQNIRRFADPTSHAMKSYALWRERLSSMFAEVGQRLAQLSAERPR